MIAPESEEVPELKNEKWKQGLVSRQDGHFTTLPSLSKPCAFGAQIFSDIMDNLIRNPNITSSHLFRADIYYDSEKDTSFAPEAWDEQGAAPEFSTFVKHMKKELRPRTIVIEGFQLRRVLVRRMVPRNPGLDKDLVQTCCFFRSRTFDPLQDDPQLLSESRELRSGIESTLEKNLVVYLPHVDSEDAMPWYHPKVRVIGFLHEIRSKLGDDGVQHVTSSQPAKEVTDNKNTTAPYEQSSEITQIQASISLHLIPFPSATLDISSITDTDSQSSNRLHRTLQNLLQTIARHGAGKLEGYQKRAHHDRLIPQSRLQDTYTRLKQKHAKYILHECWKETTDATKGVFEDLGIAAFLIELWRDMYRPNKDKDQDSCGTNKDGAGKVTMDTSKDDVSKPSFTGFVDIACGNGVLVYILLSEGYAGYGFDARKRKTWDSFPEDVQAHLHRQVLIPDILTAQDESQSSNANDNREENELKDSLQFSVHDGRFPAGTFIISNHADELSAWTPLLAHLSDCPFICIPCCSHDLTGARFRAAASLVKQEEMMSPSTTEKPIIDGQGLANGKSHKPDSYQKSQTSKTQEKPKQKAQQPSAYATLTAYIAHLSRLVGFVPEREVLRIPSTRNLCIVGRRQASHRQLHTYQAQNVDEAGGERGTREDVNVETSVCKGGDMEDTFKDREDGEIQPLTNEKKVARIQTLIEGETRTSLSGVKKLWCERARKIANPANGQAAVSSKH